MKCFVISTFILGISALFICSALEIKKVDTPHWFPEGGEITLTCEVANTDNDHSIGWFINSKQLSNMSSGGILILNSRIGTKITSKIKFTNSSKFSIDENNLVESTLLKKGVATDTYRYFDFKVLLDKDRPNVTVSTKKTEIEIGANITLLCNARGHLRRNKLDVTWSKDGKVLKTVKQTCPGEATNLTYSISKANGSTGGIYMCRANVTTHPKETFQDNKTVSLSVIPKLIGSNGTSLYHAISKTSKVQCGIDGYPLNIIWLKKSNGTTQVISNRSHFKIEENGRRLTIFSFQADDATDFYCKNKDGNGNEIVQMFTLVKKVPPQVENKSKAKKLVFIPGKSVIVKCEIIAAPSCVSWNTFEADNETKRGVDDIPGIVPPTPCNKTLWFKNVLDVKNGQKFSCSVESVTQMFTVIKMNKPRLNGPLTKVVKVKEGDDVTLKCDIMVTPSIITWMVDDRLLNASSDSKYIIASSDMRLLKVLAVDYDDRGSIVCSAKNALNKTGVKQRINLQVMKDSSKTGSSVGMIVGIVLAVIVVVAIIAIAVYCKMKGQRNGGGEVELKKVSQSDRTDDGGQVRLLNVDNKDNN